MGFSSRWCTLVTGALVAVLAAVPVTQAGAVGHPHPTLVSADPVNNTPHVLDGTVRAIAAVGSRVYVGGTFTTVVNAGTSKELPRNYLFAFDRSTGRVIDTYVPALNAAVESIAPAPNGSSIIVGGRFKTVNGATQRSLAMLDVNGTRVTTFKGKTNGYVNKILVRGNRLVAGGRFSTVNGVARSNLAVLDATTGALDTAFTLDVTEGRTKSSGTVTKPSVQEMDADLAGNRLVVIGNFRKVEGLARQQIVMIDLPAGSVLPWYTTRYPNDPSGSNPWRCANVFDTQMRDVDFSPDGSYFVVVTTGGAPDRNVYSLCDTAARWETAGPPGALETWKNCTGGDTLYSVTTTGAAVYVGGHQRWMDNCGGKDTKTTGAFDASGIAAINPTTGLAVRTWNPGRTRGVGAEELVAAADGLYIGSDTTSLGGEYHARLGRFPMP